MPIDTPVRDWPHAWTPRYDIHLSREQAVGFAGQMMVSDATPWLCAKVTGVVGYRLPGQERDNVLWSLRLQTRNLLEPTAAPNKEVVYQPVLCQWRFTSGRESVMAARSFDQCAKAQERAIEQVQSTRPSNRPAI